MSVEYSDNDRTPLRIASDERSSDTDTVKDRPASHRSRARVEVQNDQDSDSQVNSSELP